MRFIAAVALLAICQTAIAAPPSPLVRFPGSMTSFHCFALCSRQREHGANACQPCFCSQCMTLTACG